MDLFSYQEQYPNAPGFVRGSDTSEAAAKSLSPKALNSMQERILKYMRAHYNGVTSEDVQNALGLIHQTCNARCTELVLKGWAYDTGERRPTSTGRMARVLKAVRQ